MVEQNSNHSGPFFLGRFMEPLHYYYAIFDSLVTKLPNYYKRQSKMENYSVEEIKNIVSCEGPMGVDHTKRESPSGIDR